MYKILMILFLGTALNAELVNGVSIVVKGEAITLHDFKEEMRISNVNIDDAKAILIRKKLEEVEVKERKLKVTSAEVFDDIKQTAARNNMSVSDFYEAVRNSNGLSSSQLKVKTKEKLLSQKLYSAIAYSSIAQPNQDEIKEYFELHKDEFSHPSSFDVIIYTSTNKTSLEKKINNPMLNAPDVRTDAKVLKYEEMSQELASLLQNTKANNFSPAIPNGKGAFMSFYLKEATGAKELNLDSVKSQISNMIMGDKREQVLSDYFARLKGSAEITTIRMPK